MNHYLKTGLIAIAAVFIAKMALGAVAPQYKDYL